MDLEAREMVDSAYQRTLDLVEEKKEQASSTSSSYERVHAQSGTVGVGVPLSWGKPCA